MNGAFIGKKAMTPEQLQQLGGLGDSHEELGLRAFIESPCMVILGALVPRRVLIKYVCNKLGGAHFDTKRDYTPEGTLFRRLDYVGDKITLVDKRIVYFELLSIGQTLARADDIRMFCDKVVPEA